MDSYCNPVYADYHRRAFESKLWLQRKYFPGLSQELPVLNRVKGNSMQQVPKVARILVLTLSATNNSAGRRSCKRAPSRPSQMFWCSCPADFPPSSSSPAPCCTQALPLPSSVLREGKRSTTCGAPSLVQGGFTLGHSRRLSCPVLPFHQDFSATGMWSQSELRVPRTNSKQESKQTTLRLKAILYPTS